MSLFKAVCLSLLIISSTSAAEVTLVDGRRFSGVIVSPLGAECMKLKMHIGSIVMYREFDVGDIKHVSTQDSKQQRQVTNILQRRERLGSNATAPDIWSLALLLKKNGQDIRYRSFARDVISKDPQHKAAREALGYVFFNNKWMSPREKHIAQGHVLFEGKWIPASDRLAILDKREGKRLTKAEQERAAKDAAAQKHIALEAALLAKKEKEAEEKSSSSGGETTPIKRKPVLYIGPFTNSNSAEESDSPSRQSANYCPQTGRRL